MQKIPLDMLKVGMVVGNDVIGGQGAVLAQGKSTVDEAMVRRLFMAGIDEVVVKGEPVPGYDMGYNVSQMCTRLPEIFKEYANDPFMKSMYAILLKHFKERI